MNFELKEAIEVLERTPRMLEQFLSGLSEAWLQYHEKEGTWNVSEVVEHLIEGEKHNWIPRIQTILDHGKGAPFPPFDRDAHLQKPKRSLEQMLQEFNEIRSRNIAKLKAVVDPEAHLELTGTHPAFGEVRLRELLSTWVVHDLTHLSQIVRVMADRYREDVRPWKAYLGILKK